MQHDDSMGLTLNGTPYDAVELQELCHEKLRAGPSRLAQWEYALYRFLQQWMDPSQTIEQFTSGSTGKPKRLQLRKDSLRSSAWNTCTYFDLQPGATALLCLPVDYIAGKMMVVRAFVGGLNLITTTPSSIPSLPEKIDFDLCSMVPMQLHALMEARCSLERIGTLLVGGAPLPAGLEDALASQPCKIYATYGMAETCSHVAIRKIGNKNNRSVYTAIGKVRFTTDKRGCLVIDADWLEGTVVTNDLVHLIDKDTFQWLGRIDNVINSGGSKVFPEEVEAVIERATGLQGVVMGVPDPKFGERVVFVLERSSTAISLERLHDALAGLLPRFSMPKEIRWIESIPRNSASKVDRPSLRDMLKSPA